MDSPNQLHSSLTKPMRATGPSVLVCPAAYALVLKPSTVESDAKDRFEPTVLGKQPRVVAQCATHPFSLVD